MRKKLIKSALSFLLLGVLILSCIPITFAATGEKEVRILFTQDMHSNILPYDILNESGDVVSVGGYARLKTAIDSYKTNSTVIVDAGDFSMGTFFNAIFKTKSPDLTLMGAMGYDATTIGNHEFDYYVEGLTEALLSASGETPRMLISNLKFNEETKDVKAAFEEYGSSNYMIIERDGIEIGLFGLIGDQAQDYTGTSDPLEFKDVTESATESVAKLKEEGAQIIICLSHSGVGTTEDIDESEDVLLAQNVEGIDVIVSGHSHKLLQEPKLVEDTIIVSGGENAQYLGLLDITYEDGDVKLSDYSLIEVNETFTEDPTINSMIATYKEDVNSGYLLDLGLSFDKVMGYADHNFADLETILHTYGEYDIANLITDGYLNEVPGKEGYTTIGVINSGIIRDTFLEGEITASDIYNSLSLGMGEDGTLGYPLTEFFITGKELKALCEVDVSVFPILAEAQLFFSGVKYTYNEDRLIFNKVIDVEIQNSLGDWEPVDSDETYRVICSLYMLQMAGLVTDTTHGILSVIPKLEDGTEIKDNNDAILHYDNGNEIKEWISLSNYISTFEKNDNGISQIPDAYDAGREQKIAVNTNLITLVKHSNNFAKIVYAIVLVLIILVILIIRLIVKKVKKNKIKKRKDKIQKMKNKI